GRVGDVPVEAIEREAGLDVARTGVVGVDGRRERHRRARGGALVDGQRRRTGVRIGNGLTDLDAVDGARTGVDRVADATQLPSEVGLLDQGLDRVAGVDVDGVVDGAVGRAGPYLDLAVDRGGPAEPDRVAVGARPL